MLASGSPVLGQAQTVRGLAHSVTITIAAGAANVAGITIQAVDFDGNPVAGVQSLEVWTATTNTGLTQSSTAYSGAIAATTGAIKTQYTSKHHLQVNTDATGLWVGTLTDTAKTADFIAVKKPLGSGIVVSAVLAYG